VVVELRALRRGGQPRLADRLQEAGVQVVYGVVGYKTHAKMLLIVRREGASCAATCTWAPATTTAAPRARTPTSSLITADADIGNDVHQLFQQLSGLAPKIKLKRLLQSPFTCTPA
jgi:polyphosphate kinase